MLTENEIKSARRSNTEIMLILGAVIGMCFGYTLGKISLCEHELAARDEKEGE